MKKLIIQLKKKILKILGVKKFNYGEIEEENRIGVVTGLAWTEVGGEILKIESAIMPGKGKCKSLESSAMLCKSLLKQLNHILDQEV